MVSFPSTGNTIPFRFKLVPVKLPVDHYILQDERLVEELAAYCEDIAGGIGWETSDYYDLLVWQGRYPQNIRWQIMISTIAYAYWKLEVTNCDLKFYS